MGLSRRMFTKEFKLAAVRRLEQGVSIGEVARALEVNPNVLHRWRREFRQGSGNAYPVRLLSHRFRKKFLWQLRQAFRHGALRFTGELRSLAYPAAFQALCEKAAKIEWVVHVKPPFGGPQRVLKYLARYTHRVAISNHRLRALENGRVSFDWKDYADHSRTRP